MCCKYKRINRNTTHNKHKAGISEIFLLIAYCCLYQTNKKTNTRDIKRAMRNKEWKEKEKPMNFHSLTKYRKEESRTIKMRDSNSEIFNVFLHDHKFIILRYFLLLYLYRLYTYRISEGKSSKHSMLYANFTFYCLEENFSIFQFYLEIIPFLSYLCPNRIP